MEKKGMNEVYFSETDPEKVLSEMDPHHQAEFRIYSLGDTLGKLIWVGNVLEDIIHQADNPQFVKEHARDLKRALHITMLEVAK